MVHHTFFLWCCNRVCKRKTIWGLGVWQDLVSLLCRISVGTLGELYKPRCIEAPCTSVCHLQQAGVSTLSLLALASSLHTESNSTALLHWSVVQMETSDGKMFVWQMESGIRTDKPWNTMWTLSMHPAFLRCSVRLHAPFLAFCTICKVMQLRTWIRPYQQACNIYGHRIGLIPALCVPADGLRPLPLGTGGNNSTSSWGIWATFCRNIFSRAWAMRTMSSVGCRKKTSLSCVICSLKAKRFKIKFWNPQWHCPSNKWWYPLNWQ